MTINALQIVGGPATVTFNSANLGPTQGGVILKTEVEHKKVFVDQSTMVLKKLAKSKEAQVELILMHYTSANLQVALGSSALGFGGNNASPEHQLVVAGPGPSGTTRTFTFWKASVTGSTEVKNEKGEEIGIKVTFDAIADTSKSADQQLFQWA
jgi:hypothetical protein